MTTTTKPATSSVPLEADASHRERRSFWRRLDFLPAPLAAGVGMVAGVAAGFSLLSGSLVVGGPLFVVCIGLGLWLAGTGRAVVTRAMVREEPESGTYLDDLDDVESEEEPALDHEALAIDDSQRPEPGGAEGGRDEYGPGGETRDEEFDALAMVQVEGGMFVMGGDGQAERPVMISALECMVYPVTRGLHAEIMGADPGWPDESSVPTEELERMPVNNVSWRDAIAFCNALSSREGLTPCYRVSEQGSAEQGSEHEPESGRDDVVWDREADGYRLPTEAEWEFLCRAGTRTLWSFGDDESLLGEYAWFKENSDSRTHPVGQKKPNGWGLHDMHGNVWEWCWDWYAPYPDAVANEPEQDPAGPPKADAVVSEVYDHDLNMVRDRAKLLRGGSFDDWARFVRCAFRNGYLPSFRGGYFGFRCVRGGRRQP